MQLNEEQINAAQESFSELEDGLFAFASQALWAIDTFHCVDCSKSPDAWVATVYRYAGDAENEYPEVMNISDCAHFGHFASALGRERFLDCYEQVEQAGFTTHSEMMAYFSAKLSVLNHF